MKYYPSKPVQQENQLLTITDVSILLQRSRRALYTDIALGRIPAPVRIGRAIRWRREDVMRAIDALAK
ncbi:MAG: helix-turn-helix domain-containing protein [Phycisphaerae bacterium]